MKRVIILSPQSFPERKSANELFDYIRKHGMEPIRWESFFHDLLFIEVDNVPDVLPANIVLAHRDFEFTNDGVKRLQVELMNKNNAEWEDKNKGNISSKNSPE